MAIPIPFFVLPLPVIAFQFIFQALKKRLKNKTLLLFGQPGSGKTILYQWLTKGKYEEKYSPTWGKVGEKTKPYKEFLDNEYNTYYRDWGGDVSLRSDGEAQKNIRKECDIVLHVLDMNKYLNDNKYFIMVNAEFDTLFRNIKPEKILIVGTHVDELDATHSENVNSLLLNRIKGKEYFHFVNNTEKVFVNLKKKKDVVKVYTKIGKIVRK